MRAFFDGVGEGKTAGIWPRAEGGLLLAACRT
jgi:hypothetical protein